MSSQNHYSQTGGAALVGWVVQTQRFARRLYDLEEPITNQSDIDLSATRYTGIPEMLGALARRGAVDCVARYPDSSDAERAHYVRTDVFESLVEEHTTPREKLDGWCKDPDCSRQSVTWDDGESVCKCGARLE